MLELSYACYVRKKVCVTSLDMASMYHAIGNDDLISIQQTVGTESYMTTAGTGGASTKPLKLVPLNSNLMGDDDDGGGSNHNLIPHVSALGGITRKVIRLADLREQQRVKSKDTKNELGHWRHTFSNIIIIVARYIQLLITLNILLFQKLVCLKVINVRIMMQHKRKIIKLEVYV